MNSQLKKTLLKKAKEKAGLIEKYEEISINRLEENPYQPRIEIKENEIKELANSIKENGLLQPILVQKKDNRYIIISGHRRVKAHQLLGKTTIKAIIITNQKNSELAKKAIIENLQRKDLNVIETAIALKKYKEEFNKTLDEIATEIGKDKGFVSKLLNILNLPNKIIQDVKENKTTKDVRALAMLNTYLNKQKKLDMSNSSISLEDEIFKLYQDFLKNGREWLKKEIDKKLQKTKEKELIEIKNTKREITIKINKKIDKNKLDNLKEDLEKILKKYI